MKRLTNQQFIDKANQVHSGKFNYSKVKYVNKKTKIIIICPKHGEFIKRADSHLYDNQGCTKCSKSKKISGLKKYRKEMLAFLVEGVKGVEEALSHAEVLMLIIDGAKREETALASLIKKAIKTGTCSLSGLLPIGKVDKTCWMKVQPSFDCLVNKACNWNINDLGDCLQSVIDISWQLSKHYNFCLDPDALYLFKVLTKAVYKLPPHVETAEAIERL